MVYRTPPASLYIYYRLAKDLGQMLGGAAADTHTPLLLAYHRFHPELMGALCFPSKTDMPSTSVAGSGTNNRGNDTTLQVATTGDGANSAAPGQ